MRAASDPDARAAPLPFARTAAALVVALALALALRPIDDVDVWYLGSIQYR